MLKIINRIVAFTVMFCLVFEQSGFAQVAPAMNVPAYLNGLVGADKFRPMHMRWLSYDSLSNSFDLAVERGDDARIKEADIKKSTAKIMEYFQIGLRLPESMFWVNLRPDAADQIIDPYLGRTDIGKIMLEADLQLKKDLARFTSPDTKAGREYWNKLYARAEQIFGPSDISIPTVTRPWIVPNEIIIKEYKDGAYVYKATMKVMLEQDHLKDAPGYAFDDPRMQELNEYSSQLVRQLIIPQLTREVNSSKRYSGLRQVFYSLVLSQWFKQRYAQQHAAEAQEGSAPNVLLQSIDSRDLSGLTSRAAWSKQAYFDQYVRSFQKGEYNKQETIAGAGGMTVRQYFSGGILFKLQQGVQAIGRNSQPLMTILPAAEASRSQVPAMLRASPAWPAITVNTDGVVPKVRVRVLPTRDSVADHFEQRRLHSQKDGGSAGLNAPQLAALSIGSALAVFAGLTLLNQSLLFAAGYSAVIGIVHAVIYSKPVMKKIDSLDMRTEGKDGGSSVENVNGMTDSQYVNQVLKGVEKVSKARHNGGFQPGEFNSVVQAIINSLTAIGLARLQYVRNNLSPADLHYLKLFFIDKAISTLEKQRELHEMDAGKPPSEKDGGRAVSGQVDDELASKVREIFDRAEKSVPQAEATDTEYMHNAEYSEDVKRGVTDELVALGPEAIPALWPSVTASMAVRQRACVEEALRVLMMAVAPNRDDQQGQKDGGAEEIQPFSREYFRSPEFLNRQMEQVEGRKSAIRRLRIVAGLSVTAGAVALAVVSLVPVGGLDIVAVGLGGLSMIGFGVLTYMVSRVVNTTDVLPAEIVMWIQEQVQDPFMPVSLSAAAMSKYVANQPELLLVPEDRGFPHYNMVLYAYPGQGPARQMSSAKNQAIMASINNYFDAMSVAIDNGWFKQYGWNTGETMKEYFQAQQAAYFSGGTNAGRHLVKDLAKHEVKELKQVWSEGKSGRDYLKNIFDQRVREIFARADQSRDGGKHSEEVRLLADPGAQQDGGRVEARIREIVVLLDNLRKRNIILEPQLAGARPAEEVAVIRDEIAINRHLIEELTRELEAKRAYLKNLPPAQIWAQGRIVQGRLYRVKGDPEQLRASYGSERPLFEVEGLDKGPMMDDQKEESRFTGHVYRGNLRISAGFSIDELVEIPDEEADVLDGGNEFEVLSVIDAHTQLLAGMAYPLGMEDVQNEATVGGIDFRVMPAVVVPAAVPGSAVTPVAAVDVRELERRWASIQHKVSAGQMPYEDLCAYVSACCVNKEAYTHLDKAALWVSEVLRMEEDGCVETSAQMKELIALL